MHKFIIKLLFSAVLLSAFASAQTTTIINGTIKSLTGSVVTSGQITFTLRPGLDTTISGSARYVPNTVTCKITGAGAIKALDGTSDCVVTNNTSLTPGGSYYLVCIQPSNIAPGSCFNYYALGVTTDISTVVPTPTTSPAYNFVDLHSTQQIDGAKTFTGSTSFTGTLTFGALTVATINANAVVSRTANPASAGFVRLASADAIKWRNNANGGDISLQKTGAVSGNTPADTFDVSAFGGIKAPSLLQLGGTDTGLSRDSAGVVDIGNGAQGDKTGTLLLSKMAAGGTAASGSVAGDITAARSATSGSYYIGTDGLGFLFRNGNTVTITGTSLTWTLPATTDTLVGKATTDTLTNKTYGGTTQNKQTFSSNGTFTIPANVTSVKVTIVAAGGAGGGATTTAGSGGGGMGGGWAIKYLSGLTPGNTIAVTVGTGGTGVANNTGNTGGNSSIASGTQTITTVTALGGAGGFITGIAAPTNPGLSTNGDINGAPSYGQIASFTNSGGTGGPSYFGGGGTQGGAGAGGAGNAPGSGGGGAGGTAGGTVAGGAGANGIVIFEWVQ